MLGERYAAGQPRRCDPVVMLVDDSETLRIDGPYPALVFSGIFTLCHQRRAYLKKIFCRRFVAKSHMRTALIIIDPPSLNQSLCLG